MGEIKSVKVDNWGVFFLQKLQNFFNKTDYCDLTLQFNDNSQLKVHKLVLNACTDYFNILEQTCETVEDILIMPNELQADLVVPIVNFMYTGTLEFELKMYGKLLKTARDMNMTVLLKLLEAHRRTMEGNTKQNVRNSTKVSPRTAASNRVERVIHTPSINVRRVNTPVKKTYQGVEIRQLKNNQQAGYIKRSSTATTSTSTETVASKYPANKHIKEEEEDAHEQLILLKQESGASSPFEQLRKTGYNNNKRPAASVLQQPSAKKPNIQDVKEYAEQQRVRKQIAEEYGDDQEYSAEIFDDEYYDDDDEETGILQHQNKNMKQEQKPTIVVKDSASSNVDHAKIISEVLRKYPHLIKNNKNIKLRIMPNTSGQQTSSTQKVIIRNEPITGSNKLPAQPKPLPVRPEVTIQRSLPTEKAAVASSQPRRIDSKTMKALIALGAENTTGPWLCLRCGVNGRPISIPSYRGFRRHLINTHREKIDPRLCENCGWRSTDRRELAFHMYTEHQIKQEDFNFPKCEHCNQVVIDSTSLEQHIDDIHPDKKEDNQQCIYCNKTFSTELMLYNHMRAQHKERAREDGVIDFTDDDEEYDEEQLYSEIMAEENETTSNEKIHILSDIKLPKSISLTQVTKASSEANGLNSVAAGIATSLGLIDGTTEIGDIINTENIQTATTITSMEDDQPRFVNPDGTEMELSDEQREEILKQLESGADGGVVMVLNDSFVPSSETDAQTDDNSQTEFEKESEIKIDESMLGEGSASQDKIELDLSEEKKDHTEEDADHTAEHIKSHTEENKENREEDKDHTEEEEPKSEDESEHESIEDKEEQKFDNKEKNTNTVKPELNEKVKDLAGDWSEDEDTSEDEMSSEDEDTSEDKEDLEKEEEIDKEVIKKEVKNEPEAESKISREKSDPDLEDKLKDELNASQDSDTIERELAKINQEFNDNEEEEEDEEEGQVNTSKDDGKIVDEIKLTPKEDENECTEDQLKNIAQDKKSEKKDEKNNVDENIEDDKDKNETENSKISEDKTSDLEESFELEEPILDIPEPPNFEDQKSNDSKTGTSSLVDERAKEKIKSLIGDWGDDD